MKDVPAENYQDFIGELRTTLCSLRDYWRSTGNRTAPENTVAQLEIDLDDSDPFVVYAASHLAVMVIEGNSVFH